MARTAQSQTVPPSRLRRRLAASVILLGPLSYGAFAPFEANAASTLMIDSRGATYVIGSRNTGAAAVPLPPRRPGRGPVARSSQPVTLDLSVLSTLGQTRPENRQGPLRLNRPSRLLADAGDVQPGQRIVLRPPRRTASAPMIKLKPPKPGGAAGGQQVGRGQYSKLALAPLPPRRSGAAVASAPIVETTAALATAPMPPSRQAAQVASTGASVAASAGVSAGDFRQTPPPLVASANGQADLSAPAYRPPADLSADRTNGAVGQVADLSPVSAPGMTLPPPQIAAAPILLGASDVRPASIAERPSGLEPSAEPAVGERPRTRTASISNMTASLAPSEPQTDALPPPAVQTPVRTPTVQAAGSLDQRERFPVIYNRADPPEMAKPGWQSGAPEAADREARGVSDLPDLASLAPVADADARPGEPILAPAPPPIRDLPEGRAEEIAALTERRRDPLPEQPLPEPRKALTVPANLARVSPPGGDRIETALTELAPPSVDDEIAEAPDFAPLPLPEAGIEDLVAIQPTTDDARTAAPQQLSLALEAEPAPVLPLRRAGRDRALETEIAFASESRALPAEAETQLSLLAERMKADPKLRVELSAAAKSAAPRRARDLAIARALAVQRYLVRKGVLSESIVVEPVTSKPGKDAVAVWLVEPA